MPRVKQPPNPITRKRLSLSIERQKHLAQRRALKGDVEVRKIALEEKRLLREEADDRIAAAGLAEASKINAQVEKEFASDDLRGRIRAAMSLAGANVGLVGSVIARAMASGDIDTAMDAVKLWSGLAFSVKGEKPAGDSGEDDEFGRLFEIALRRYKAGAGKAGSSKD